MDEHAGTDVDYHQSGSDPLGPQPIDNPFPWMGEYQPVSIEDFPLSRGPILHEGYIPDQALEPVHTFLPSIQHPDILPSVDYNTLPLGGPNESDEDPSFLLSEEDPE